MNIEKCVCARCGAPVLIELGDLSLQCPHCDGVHSVYPPASIMRDGIQIFTLPDLRGEKDFTVIRELYELPDSVEAPRVWSPHWYFAGDVEGFATGRRYSLGLSGDRVQRASHRSIIEVKGRLLPAWATTRDNSVFLTKYEAPLLESIGRPDDEPVHPVELGQEDAIFVFEECLKKEFLTLKPFRFDRCDRFQLSLRNFTQHLVYVPTREWRYGTRKPVLLNCNNGHFGSNWTHFAQGLQRGVKILDELGSLL